MPWFCADKIFDCRGFMNKKCNYICLDGRWQLFYEENYKCAEKAHLFTDIDSLRNSNFKKIDADVPGNFELDLMREGIIADLFMGKNVLAARNLENLHLWYATEFDVTDSDGKWFFGFEGIDTFSEIYLNGEKIAYTDNMLISHEIEAAGLCDGKNELVVHILPTVIQARKNIMGASSYVYQAYNADSLCIRKAPYMFGWDIMPRIVSGGIWRSVSLYRKNENRIEDIYLSTVKADEQYASLYFYYRTAISQDFSDGYYIKIRGVCKERVFEQKIQLWHTEGACNLTVENPYLWWPKGMGAPELYTVQVELCRDGEICDSETLNFGIRTVNLEMTDFIDDDGNGEFCFYVNGQKMFVRGTNWVPLDAFPSRSKSRLNTALELLDATNCNMVRCWGGNAYEDHDFFDFCDSHGIAVWQDFAMGCAAYPQNEDFARSIKAEAESIVCKLRNHTSIFLWAGDNEGDEAIQYWTAISQNPNNNILTRKVLPEVIRSNDFLRVYLPSSPYCSARAYKEEKPIPEKHLWGPRRYFKDKYYSEAVCRFVSETGYHGCPHPDSIKQFISSDKLWPWSDNDEWLTHATCMQPYVGAPYSYRIELMANQVCDLFGEKKGALEDFWMASQITQAEAVKYFIEKFRLSKWEKHTGIIWWNLLDGWPQFSDAVVDYYYRKKIGYEVIVNSQHPVALMFREPENGILKLAATNDSLEDVSLTYRVYNLETDSVLASGTAVAKANLTVDIDVIKCDESKTAFYIVEWDIDGETHKNHYLCGKAPVSYSICVDGYKKMGLI